MLSRMRGYVQAIDVVSKQLLDLSQGNEGTRMIDDHPEKLCFFVSSQFTEPSQGTFNKARRVHIFCMAISTHELRHQGGLEILSLANETACIFELRNPM